MAHAGTEGRPAEPYFAAERPHEHSQGNLYASVPYLLPSDALGGRLTVVARDVMLVTRSCELDYGASIVQVAPLIVLADRVTQGQAEDIRMYDCFHDVMYLPEEAGLPERLVNFGGIQGISLDILVRCERQARLSYVGTQQLHRKLALHWTGLHIPRADFQPPADDF